MLSHNNNNNNKEPQTTDEKKRESIDHFNAFDTLFTKNLMALDSQSQDNLIAILDKLKKQIEESTAFKNSVYNQLNSSNRAPLKILINHLSLRNFIKKPSLFLEQTDAYLKAIKEMLYQPETSLEYILEMTIKNHPKLFKDAGELLVVNKLSMQVYDYLTFFEIELAELKNLFAIAITNEKNNVKLNPAASEIDAIIAQKNALNQIFSDSGIRDQLLKIIDEYFFIHAQPSKIYKDLMGQKLKNVKSQTKNDGLDQGILEYERMLRAQDNPTEPLSTNHKLGEMAIKFYSIDRTWFENFRQFIVEENLPLQLQANLRAVDFELLFKKYLEKDNLAACVPLEVKAVLPESFKPLTVQERFEDVTNLYENALTKASLGYYRTIPKSNELNKFLALCVTASAKNENLQQLCFLINLTKIIEDAHLFDRNARLIIFKKVFASMQQILEKSQKTPAYSFHIQNMYSYLIQYYINDESLRYVIDTSTRKEIAQCFTTLLPPTNFEDKSIPEKFHSIATQIKKKQNKYYQKFNKYIDNFADNYFEYDSSRNTPKEPDEVVFKKMAANEYFLNELKTNPSISAETLRHNINENFGPEVFKSRGHFKSSRLDTMLKDLTRIQKTTSAAPTKNQKTMAAAQQDKPTGTVTATKKSTTTTSQETKSTPPPSLQKQKPTSLTQKQTSTTEVIHKTKASVKTTQKQQSLRSLLTTTQARKPATIKTALLKQPHSEESKIEVCEPEATAFYQSFIESPGFNIESPNSPYGFRLFDNIASSNKQESEHGPTHAVEHTRKRLIMS